MLMGVGVCMSVGFGVGVGVELLAMGYRLLVGENTSRESVMDLSRITGHSPLMMVSRCAVCNILYVRKKSRYYDTLSSRSGIFSCAFAMNGVRFCGWKWPFMFLKIEGKLAYMAIQKLTTENDPYVSMTDFAMVEQLGDAVLLGNWFVFLKAEWLRRSGMERLLELTSTLKRAMHAILFRGKEAITLPGARIAATPLPNESLVSLTCDKALYRAKQRYSAFVDRGTTVSTGRTSATCAVER